MEIIISKEYFNKAITDVSKAISNKTAFPFFSGIKLVASTDRLTLIGRDSDIIIETIIPSTIKVIQVLNVYATGSVVISAKYLLEIAKKLPNDICIKVDEAQVATIQSEEIVIKVNGFDPSQYPSIPEIYETKHAEIQCSDLIEMVKQTTFAISKSNSKPVLTGVHMTFAENHLQCVATNSQRLALRELPIISNIHGSYIVPSTSLNHLAKLLSSDDRLLQIFLTGSYIVFQTKTITLYARLIEGIYPNVSSLFPKVWNTIITMNTNLLLKGIDRASIFSSEWKNNNVKLAIKKGEKLRISSTATEVGQIEETQNITTINGEKELTISFDGRYLIEALREIKEEEIKISFGGAMRPALIEPLGNSSYVHLISPVRTY
ncbi:DNA polymerase III subunit beta [Caldibacillus lycopersici]|uniref:Beta sliding clamp n=1 Tax=Perspicuibacillus lycopersici TaxID=1325689 RepID=A0AAE3IUA0_9BACI|nr:DNA polymerase III subunit beta [Perspicuibacillus lycopersici]MCU9614542.1 DNA polymerase III subunit beta [Perspicuibacillus lycopersici]